MDQSAAVVVQPASVYKQDVRLIMPIRLAED